MGLQDNPAALDASWWSSLLLVVVAALVSALYSVRVLRKSNDPLRWALLGVLASLALTTLPAVIAYSTDPPHLPPLWVGWATRVLATAVVVIVAWPLLRDTWRELCAWVVVGRDSWRFLWSRRNR